jgi:hypothetical protein
MANTARLLVLRPFRNAVLANIQSTTREAMEIPRESLEGVIKNQRRVRKDELSKALRILVSRTIRTVDIGDGDDEFLAEPFKWLDVHDLPFYALVRGSGAAVRAMSIAYGNRFRSDAEIDEFLRGLFGKELAPAFVPPREAIPSRRQLLRHVLTFVDVEDFLTNVTSRTATLDTTALDKYQRKPGFGPPGVLIQLTKADGGWEPDSDVDDNRVLDYTLGILGAVTIESHAIGGHFVTGLRASEITAKTLRFDHPIARILYPTELNVRSTAARARVSLLWENGAIAEMFAWTFTGAEALCRDSLIKHRNMKPELEWLRRSSDLPWVRDIREVVVRTIRKCSVRQLRQARRWASLIIGSDRASHRDVEDIATYILASSRRHVKWSCNEFVRILTALLRLDWERRTLGSVYRTVVSSLATSHAWPEFQQFFPPIMGRMEENSAIFFGI